MKKSISIAEILQLSVAERIQLVEDIWDSIAASPESIVLTDAQKEDLDRRLDEYHKDPQRACSWQDVLTRL